MTQSTHDAAPTQYADDAGIRFAYRRFGMPERPPMVFFQHFMGTLDDHDPALSDAFAGGREVILFDNAGVASSSGTVPDTIEVMARDAITFIDALGLTTIDLVGHSMGGLVAQEVALARPELVRRLVLVGTGPRGGESIGALPPSSSCTRTPATARISSTPNCSSATRASSSTISPPQPALTDPAEESREALHVRYLPAQEHDRGKSAAAAAARQIPEEGLLSCPANSWRPRRNDQSGR
jgi:pimeloyl-ACP methyl ester carboxylesterase